MLSSGTNTESHISSSILQYTKKGKTSTRLRQSLDLEVEKEQTEKLQGLGFRVHAWGLGLRDEG